MARKGERHPTELAQFKGVRFAYTSEPAAGAVLERLAHQERDQRRQVPTPVTTETRRTEHEMAETARPRSCR
jgi:hypothetical protein